MARQACRTCGEAVIWTTTIAGNRMPVDADPVANGNVVLTGSGPVPEARLLPPAELSKFDRRYVPHFATCRDAQHKRNDRAAR